MVREGVGTSGGVSRATTGATGVSQDRLTEKARKVALETPSAQGAGVASVVAASRNWP